MMQLLTHPFIIASIILIYGAIGLACIADRKQNKS